MPRLLKIAIFSLTPLLLLLIGAEVALRCIYFQSKASGITETAIQAALVSVVNRMEVQRALTEVRTNYARIASLTGLPFDPEDPKTIRKLRESLVQSLYSPVGADMLETLQQEYSADFEDFVRAVRSENSNLVVIYLPSSRPERERETCRQFYASLCEAKGATFLDLTERLIVHPSDKWLFTPEDAHPSYFANQIIARAVAEHIKSVGVDGNPRSYETRPQQLGDHEPNLRILYDYAIPYWFITNGQGFRREESLSFPKTKPRVLCIGDSFTFGSSVSNIHTYPYRLERLLSGVEVLNAGYPGYSIPDQLALYTERARFVEADWVVLQVLDNDISDLLSFYRNHFARDRVEKLYPFSKEELKFFEAVKRSTETDL